MSLLRERAMVRSVASILRALRPALARAWLWSFASRLSDVELNEPASHARVGEAEASWARPAAIIAPARRSARRRCARATTKAVIASTLGDHLTGGTPAVRHATRPTQVPTVVSAP